MNIGLYLLEDHYLPYPDDNFRMAADAGFNGIAFDFSLFLPPEDGILSESKKTCHVLTPREKVAFSFAGSIEDLKKHFLPYKAAAEKYGLKFTQMNAPFSAQIPNEAEFIQAVENCIELCEWMGCQYLTVHPIASESRVNRRNFDFFLSLAPLAREHRVTICLENRCRKFNGRYLRGFCSEPYVAVDYIDGLNRESGKAYFGFCLNTGACSLAGQKLYETVLKLGSRIRTVLINDNDSIRDQHCMPYTCARSGNWRGFICGLREIEYNGDLCFASGGSVNCFPSNMRYSVLHLVAETGRFMAEQIEIEAILKKCGRIVLFGSGNMFENYMSCYGKKYPPALIVDNNRKLWGASKRGIPVRAPESIKELAGNYGVFICNQFYYEIERQLSDMGVGHIYRFHDEYMPFVQGMEER